MKEYLKLIFLVISAIVIEHQVHSASPTSSHKSTTSVSKNRDDGTIPRAGNIPCDHKCQMMKLASVAKTPKNSDLLSSTSKPKRISKKKSAKTAKANLNASIEASNSTAKHAHSVAQKSGATNKTSKSKKKGKKSSKGKDDLKSAPEALKNMTKSEEIIPKISSDKKGSEKAPSGKNSTIKKKKKSGTKSSTNKNMTKNSDESLPSKKQAALENSTINLPAVSNAESVGKTQNQNSLVGNDGVKKSKTKSGKKKAKKISSKKGKAKGSAHESLNVSSIDKSSDDSEKNATRQAPKSTTKEEIQTTTAIKSTTSVNTEIPTAETKARRKLWVTDYPVTSSKKATEYDTRYFDAYLIVQERIAAKKAAAAALREKTLSGDASG